MIIKLPFSKLPDTRHQIIDMATCQRTEFQIRKLLEISQRKDFLQFTICIGADPEAENQEGVIYTGASSKFVISWFDDKENLHYMNIGKNRVLGEGTIWHEEKRHEQ